MQLSQLCALRKTFIMGLSCVSLLMTNPSFAVEMASRDALMMEQLSHEVTRLRQDLALMQQEFYKQKTNNSLVKTNRPRGDLSSQVEVQLSEMDEQMRQMNGRVEEAQHKVTQLQTRLEKTLEEVTARLTTLEKAALSDTKQNMVRNYGEDTDKNAPVDLTQQKKPSANTNDAKDPKADENADQAAFSEAKQLLEQAQYEPASIKFQSFITTYKDSSYLPEAYFWQGELFTIREENENAAVSFLKAYQANNKGEKAGESLVRLGGVLGNLGKNQEACTTFSKAEKEFPKLSGLKKDIEQERLRVGC